MNIAIVAHDGRKKELVKWVVYNINVLKEHKLYATGTTGKLIKEAYADWLDKEEMFDVAGDDNIRERHVLEADRLVSCLLSGPLGGDQQIGAMIAEGKIDVLIFFCDNLIMQGHQNDVSALTRLASLYNIAFATNRTTADMILTSPLLKDWSAGSYKPVLPTAIENYKNRCL
jgi:methylglyoxal synthase